MLFCNFIYFILPSNVVSSLGLWGIFTADLNWHSYDDRTVMWSSSTCCPEHQQSISYLSNHHFYLVHSSIFKLVKSNYLFVVSLFQEAYLLDERPCSHYYAQDLNLLEKQLTNWQL